MARPKKSDSDRMSKPVLVRLTTDEFDLFKTMALANKTSVTNYIRMAAREKAENTLYKNDVLDVDALRKIKLNSSS